MLKLSAFSLEKQKSFIPQKIIVSFKAFKAFFNKVKKRQTGKVFT
jgi:hypothetical protein